AGRTRRGRAWAETAAGGRPFFREIVVTGGHPASLDGLLRGEGDAASIDCVTYAFWRHYRPQAAARVRIIAETPVSPSIPFVTSVATPARVVDILRAALRALAVEPRYAEVRAGLMLTGIEDVPDAADAGLLDYAKEAAALGYPELV